jgi:hypothetical protein
MGMLRLLLLLVIAWIVWRLVARALRASVGTPAPSKGDPDYVPLTRCGVCGAHIPQPAGGLAPICERCRSR